LQAHVNEPDVSVHTALIWQLCLPSEHSFTFTHVRPSPANPILQVHVKEPVVSPQVEESAGQLCTPVTHSFTLSQTTPVPVKPVLHEHVNELAVLVHLDLVAGQL
jgi:hypothetical protein